MSVSSGIGGSSGSTSMGGRTLTRTAGHRCKCGRQSIVYTSKTERNPKRAFLGCPNFKEKKSYCDFFRWVDDICNEPMELEEARIHTVELEVAEINFKLSKGAVQRKLKGHMHPSVLNVVRLDTMQKVVRDHHLPTKKTNK
ncbi:uncharacterized protein At4g04775-like [Gastrolobium bilobum]|uniref:uncharacterized protein At4g04775-like n=1 Tax=Gastrolobium bilobum TaxID=150636 RepID=UPI002AB1744A|nr:uncharacterized protein At4g04775-like [Gastrolobium bilobum]